MSWHTLWIELVDLAARATEMGVQWLVQSTLIMGLGLAIARALRDRSAALLSTLYRTTLVAALVCPLVAGFLASAGMTVAGLPTPRIRDGLIVAAPSAIRPEQNESSRTLETAGGERRQASPADSAQANRGSLPSDESQPTLVERSRQSPSKADSAEAPAAQVRSSPVADARLVIVRPGVAALVVGISLVWLLGTLALVGWLVWGHRRLALLSQRAAPVDDETRRMCERLAALLHVAAPQLLRVPFISSPCLTGIRRAAILLPEDLAADSLPAALAHELAHLKRRDCTWNLLRQLAVAVLWPQPLVWRLSRRLEATAEEFCDDYVVELGESRQAYAAMLVSLAERSLLPASGAAVSLVTFRSLLGQRVARILDDSRRLSLTVGRKSLSLIVASGAAAVLLAALVGPQRAVADAAPPADSAVEAEPVDATTNQFVEFAGKVVTPDGKPMAGANVAIMAHVQNKGWKVFAKQATAADGTFQVRIARKVFLIADSNDAWPRSSSAVASANGYGLATEELAPFEVSGQMLEALSTEYAIQNRSFQLANLPRDRTLRLVNDLPIEGRIVDERGRGVADATVQPFLLLGNREGSLNPAVLESCDSARKAENQTLKSIVGR
jgi:beta-lactamase regulating signal transducer with metallopeptidase domain